MDYDSDAIEAIDSNNPGDLRLQSGIQVICSADINSIDKETVLEYVQTGDRDVSVGISGLAKLYKSNTALDAIKLVYHR